MIEPIYPALGTAIRALRRNSGLSQQQLADRLGYQRVSSISDLEHGRVRLQVHQLLALAELFEVPVTALLSGNVEPRQAKMVIEDVTWREW